MDRALAVWPLAVVVGVVIAVLLTELAALLTEQWRYTLSEVALRRPDLALWFVFLIGLAVGGVLGHWSTLFRR